MKKRNEEDKVYIFDTTLRDGEQSPGNSMNVNDKLRMAIKLEQVGVDIIEAGFPKSSDEEHAAVTAIAETVTKPTVVGLARYELGDIERVWDSVKNANNPGIHTFISTSPRHMGTMLKRSEEQVLKEIEKSVSYARSLCSGYVEWSAQDATNSRLGFLKEAYATAIENGANVLNIPDTLGCMKPEIFKYFVKEIIDSIPSEKRKKVRFSVHCHNDEGLAIANTLAGIYGGARQAEVAINGIGERAGNASLEEVVAAIHQTGINFKEIPEELKKYNINFNNGIWTGVDTTKVYQASRMLTSITGVEVQPNKAIVGANAFAHEAGIHQQGITKDRKNYEQINAADFGREGGQLVMGDHSGWNGVKKSAKDIGYDLSKEQSKEVLRALKKLKGVKRKVGQKDFEVLVQEAVTDVPHTYELKACLYNGGKGIQPYVSVIVNYNGETLEAKAKVEDPFIFKQSTGNGPIDAAYQALNQAIGIEEGTDTILKDWKIISVSDGRDSLAKCILALQPNGDGKKIYSSGVDKDVIVAAAEAYVRGLNLVMYHKKNGVENKVTNP